MGVRRSSSEAKAAGLATGIVSNGNGSAEVVDFLRPWLDLVKIDLKSFDDRTYRRLGGRLDPVLDTIRGFHAAGLWIEIVTLIVPGLNDSDDELRRLAGFIASVSPDVPWHVTVVPPRLPDGGRQGHDGCRLAARGPHWPGCRAALRVRGEHPRPRR